MSQTPDTPNDPPTGDQRPPGGRPRNPGAVERAAVALAGGATVPAAAEAAGVAVKTLRRWRKDDRFAARVEAIRADVLSQATNRLTSSMTRAADKLDKLIDAADEKIALQASKSTLEIGLKVRDQLELAQRLKAVEDALKSAGVKP
jgi:hypothetical protein